MDVTLKGERFQTNNYPPKVGEEAPSFSVLDLNGETVKLSDYKGEVVILSTFPDIGTSTCSRQTTTFNEKAKELKNTKIISLSTNTVEEQKHWCEAKVMATDLLHDSDRTFSKSYGLYIEELDKTARAVFVLNRYGQIVYREIVKEMADNPDFESALSAARHEEAELN